MSILKNKKNKGFSTPELMVSGGVMLALTFLTFDVMLTNAKISSAGIKASTEEAQQRSGIELLQEDILTAEAPLINANDAGKFEAHNNSTLILRQPIYDNDGNIVTGKKKIVMYMLDGPSKKTLIRSEAIQVGTGGFTFTKTDEIANDVKKFNYRLAKATSIKPTTATLSLPGTVTTHEPNAGQIRLLHIKSQNPPIDQTRDGQNSASRGIATSSLTSFVSQLVYALLAATLGSPLPPVDVLYEVDEETTSRADKSVDANQVKVWITVNGREDQPDTTLSATGMMRNAN